MNANRFAEGNQKYCVACGSCIKVCPRQAISVPDGVSAVIDKSRCIGCGLCAKACPASVIKVVNKIV